MRKILLLTLAFLWGGVSLVLAQNVKVSGTVLDESGEKVAGATVTVIGTTIGTTTGTDGRFTLMAPADGSLRVSFIGYLEQDVPVAGKTNLEITLHEDTKAIDDVIVVAYGTAKKESFTGSVAVVGGDELEQRKYSNVTKALDGLAPGVQVTSGSGQPGSGSTVVVRGFGSINASNTPLYVVDGVPFDGAMSSINPDDIASISILKDASASVLYGSRGANGVVLITTKKGNPYETTVNLKVNIGIASRAIPRYETVGAKDFLEVMYSAFANEYGKGAAISEMMYGEQAIFGEDMIYNPYDVPVNEIFDRTGRVRSDLKPRWDEDWLGAVTNNAALRQEYGASISGGNNKTQYMLSLGYLNEDGVLKTTNMERYSARLNVETQVKPWFSAGMGLNFARVTTNSSETSTSATSNVFYSAQLMAPIYPIYMRDADTGGYILNENGKRQFDYGDSRPAGQQGNFNSIATLFDDKYGATNYTVSPRAHMEFMGVDGHWTEGLQFQLNIGADYYNTSQLTYYNPYFGNAADFGGRISRYAATSLGYTFNQLLSYNRNFGLHNVDILAGHEWYAYESSTLSGQKTGLPGAGIYELDAATTISDVGSSSDYDRIESFLTRVGYSYDDRYYVSASWRTDGSSRFAPEKRWGNFWSVGASWRLSQESFMAGADWLDNLTLKASYGVQGNNEVGSFYAYQALYDTSYSNGTLPGAIIGEVANHDLTWETNHNLNVGIEASFLHALDLSVEYYNRKTTDMLLYYPLPSSSGFDGYYRNSGSMRNRGVEFALTGHIFNRKNFQWDVTVMGSTVNNKVLKLTEDGQDIMASGIQIIREGESLYSFYVARSAGVDPLTGSKMYYAKNADGEDYITLDRTVAQRNREIVGSRMPDLYGSLSTSLRWKNLDFSISTNYSIGGKIYDGVYNELMNCYYVAQAKHKNILRAWRQPGDVTDVPRYQIGETSIVTDDKLIDASYFSIKNITLGYTLPKTWCSKIGMKSIRLSASVDNLHIFTHLKGMDPQYNLTGGTSYVYAPTRTVSFNLDIKF